MTNSDEINILNYYKIQLHLNLVRQFPKLTDKLLHLSEELLHLSDEMLHFSAEMLHLSDKMLHLSHEMLMKCFIYLTKCFILLKEEFPTDRVVNDICQSPGHCDGQKRQTENNVVYESNDDDVCHPHSLAAEVR